MSTVLTLGGVDLNASMIWTDREQTQGVAQTTDRTLGGALIVYSQALSLGGDITLVAGEDSGWLTKFQVDEIKGLAAIAGATYTLDIDTSTFDVIFRHHEAPAVDFTPLISRLNPGIDDYYIGTIKLTKV